MAGIREYLVGGEGSDVHRKDRNMGQGHARLSKCTGATHLQRTNKTCHGQTIPGKGAGPLRVQWVGGGGDRQRDTRRTDGWMARSEEDTSELQSPVATSYAGFRLKKKRLHQGYRR